MDNIGRLFDQVAAEAGVSANRAKLAVYVMGLASAGRSLADTANALRRKPDTVKVLARDFMIDFPDYRPFARDELAGRDRPEPKYLLDCAR
jgi:hypothetical protein